LAVIFIAAVVFFFLHFSNSDYEAITGFSDSYENFDKAISDLGAPIAGTDVEAAPAIADLVSKARLALAKLVEQASIRISSLTKNDSELMSTELEIADLAGSELNMLKAYKDAIATKNGQEGQLAKAFSDLTSQRQAAYAHFQQLLGQAN
jgi:hypothetical protein